MTDRKAPVRQGDRVRWEYAGDVFTGIVIDVHQEFGYGEFQIGIKHADGSITWFGEHERRFEVVSAVDRLGEVAEG